MSDIFEMDKHAQLLGYASLNDQVQYSSKAAEIVSHLINFLVPSGFFNAIPVIEVILARIPNLREEVGVDAQQFFSPENLQKVFARLDKSSIQGIFEDINIEM